RACGCGSRGGPATGRGTARCRRSPPWRRRPRGSGQRRSRAVTYAAMHVPWKLVGLAGAAGVAATGVVVVRKRRNQTEYDPEELRARLHERLGEVDSRAAEAADGGSASGDGSAAGAEPAADGDGSAAHDGGEAQPGH